MEIQVPGLAVIVGGVFALVLILALLVPGRKKPGAKVGKTDLESFPFRSRGAMLTPAELKFYRALRLAVGLRWHISFKPRLADVIKSDHRTQKQGHHNRISQKHVDFVLVHPETTAIVACIELDDASHRQASQQARDRFLESALNAARVPLARFAAAGTYDEQAIARTLAELLGEPTLTLAAPDPDAVIAADVRRNRRAG